MTVGEQLACACGARGETWQTFKPAYTPHPVLLTWRRAGLERTWVYSSSHESPSSCGWCREKQPQGAVEIRTPEGPRAPALPQATSSAVETARRVLEEPIAAPAPAQAVGRPKPKQQQTSPCPRCRSWDHPDCTPAPAPAPPRVDRQLTLL